LIKRSTRSVIALVAALGACFWYAPAQAEQSHFLLTPGDDTVTYAYAWKDQFGNAQDLSFVMPKENVLKSALDFDQSGIDHMKRRVEKAVERYAKGYRNRMNLQVQFDEKDKMHVYGNFKTQGERERMTAALENLRRRTIYEYMEENMVTFGPYQELVPDVARVAAEYAKYFVPVIPAATQKVAKANQRGMANFLLGLIQTIPMPDKRTAHFTLPLSTMTLNKGRHASKAAAYAALMRAMYPELRMITLNMRDKVYIGLDIPARESDYTLQVYDHTFVIADPAAPRPIEVGEVTVKAGDNDQYTYFEVPRP